MSMMLSGCWIRQLICIANIPPIAHGCDFMSSFNSLPFKHDETRMKSVEISWNQLKSVEIGIDVYRPGNGIRVHFEAVLKRCV